MKTELETGVTQQISASEKNETAEVINGELETMGFWTQWDNNQQFDEEDGKTTY